MEKKKKKRKRKRWTEASSWGPIIIITCLWQKWDCWQFIGQIELITLLQGKKILPWSLTPLTFILFIQLLLQGRTEVLFTTFLESYSSAFALTFPERKNSVFPGLVTVRMNQSPFGLFKLLGSYSFPCSQVTRGSNYQLECLLFSFFFPPSFFLFKRETPIVVLLYASLKSSHKQLQSY